VLGQAGNLREERFQARSTFPFVTVAAFSMPHGKFHRPLGITTGLAGRVMFRLSVQQIDGMRQDRQGGAQGTDRACRTTGNIQDHGRPEGPANGAAEYGHGGLVATLRAHQLSHALEQAFADRACGLGSDIAGADARSPCGNHQLGLAGCTPQCVLDGLSLVWNRIAKNRLKVVCVQRTGNGGTRKVFPQPAGAGVADCDDGGGPAIGRMRLVSHVFDCTNSGKSLDLMRK
jgi:hypothetical protein